jgi:hypothetical protein
MAGRASTDRARIADAIVYLGLQGSFVLIRRRAGNGQTRLAKW